VPDKPAASATQPVAATSGSVTVTPAAVVPPVTAQPARDASADAETEVAVKRQKLDDGSSVAIVPAQMVAPSEVTSSPVKANAAQVSHPTGIRPPASQPMDAAAKALCRVREGSTSCVVVLHPVQLAIYIRGTTQLMTILC